MSDKIQKTIIRSDLVENRLFAFHTLVPDHISLILPVVDVYRLHPSMTSGCPIPGICIIHVFGTETERAMIPCRPFRMDGNGLMAVFAFEGFIVHHESHILWRGRGIEMVGEFSEELYELRFVEGVLLHESAERFRGIIEDDIVVSFPDHNVEESSFLMPGKYSFPVREGVFLHDAVQEEIDIPDDTVLPNPVGDGILSVFLMVHELVSGTEFPKDEYLIEKEKGEFFGQFPEKSIRLFGEINKRV